MKQLSDKELDKLVNNEINNNSTDDELDAFIDNTINENSTDDELDNFLNNELEQEQPQEEVIEEKKFNPLTASYDELNEKLKEIAQDKLNARNEWEANHPIISRLQADYMPFYRSGRTTLEQQAKYGNDIPVNELLKGITTQIGQASVPYINSGRDALLTLLTKGKSGFVPSILKNAGAAAIQSGTADALDELSNNGIGNIGERATRGAALGGGVGGGITALLNTLPLANKIPFVPPMVEYLKRVGQGAGRGLLESFAMGKDVIDRIGSSPRGTQISKNADYYGSPEFLNDIANRFKGGLDTFKSQERESFAKARDNLISNNQDNFDISNIINDTYNNLINEGLITPEGISRTGTHATNLKSLIDDLASYEGQPLTAQELQNLKTDILDDIIDYRPAAGENLNNATRKLQNVAKTTRQDVNSLLREKLGDEYTLANQKISNILDVLNNTPELKDFTNAQNIDTLANKLKQAGTTRVEARNAINNLENLMNKNGVKISDTSLVDDILDYQAAKEIQNRIRTGQDTQFRNIPRKAIIQPATEFYFDRIKPAIPQVKKIGNLIKGIVKPLGTKAAVETVPMLYGGVSNTVPVDEYNNYDTNTY